LPSGRLKLIVVPMVPPMPDEAWPTLVLAQGMT
jgi:hypothetical protein